MSLPTGQAPLTVLKFQKRKKRVLSQYWKINAEYGRHCTTASPGHDIGIVTLTENWWKSKWRKRSNPDSNEVPKSTEKQQKDIDIWSAAREKEEPMKVRAVN
jgi:hypothetical protein